MRLIEAFSVLWLLAYTASAITWGFNSTVDDFSKTAQPLQSRALANGVPLRIMCLGASIVYGYTQAGTSDDNALIDQIVAGGNSVDMVGSQHGAGSMDDNDVEAWPGAYISKMNSKVDLTASQQPNLVLVHVGSNDMTDDIDVENAHSRLAAVFDHIFATIPDVTILASTLLPRTDATYNARTKIYNANIVEVVRNRQFAGKRIHYVDFSSSWFSPSDLFDGLHPTAAGYQKMAAVWYQGIQIVAGAGFLELPGGIFTPPVHHPSQPCNIDYAPGKQIQFGSPTYTDDGPYVHTGVSVGGFWGFDNPPELGYNNPLSEGVYWADINGDGIDDYVYVPINANGGIGVALSLGDGKLGPYLWWKFDIYCLRRGVRFADFTGDGRDDFCCLAPNGDLQCWENTPGADARRPNWVDMGWIMLNKGPEYPQETVRLADIDGDGRADYVVINMKDKMIWGWRNVAVTNVKPDYWYAFGGIFENLPNTDRPLAGWRFHDLNGDHKDDLIYVGVAGQCYTWINKRGFEVGLTPTWVAMGITHGGGTVPVNVTFGAFMGSGRADFSTIAYGGLDKNVYVDRYRNDDHGGERVKADGVRYCDMTGTGRDDLVWISIYGEITVFGNPPDFPNWKQYGIIYNLNYWKARADIHLADFDGDGRCDILVVDKASGQTKMIRNDFADGVFKFTDVGVVTGTATCTEDYKYGLHDIGVHWADIDGDKRADFLCMASNGAIKGYLNKGVGNMVWQGQIKKEEGRERNNLRLADIDGDGKADLVWIDPLNGAARAFKNLGPSGAQLPASPPTSAFQWADQGTVFAGGRYRGNTIELPNLTGSKAEYVAIEPDTGKAWLYQAACQLGSQNPGPPLISNVAAPPYPMDYTTV